MAEDLLNTATFGESRRKEFPRSTARLTRCCADPFAADELDESAATTKSTNYVHIRIQQRNGRKTLTTASGIPQEVNFEKVLKVFKKNFCCNGTIVKDPELGNVIQLQGDQRKKIAQFLIDEQIVKKESIKIHGA
jgi:translation initiation factor 1